MIVKGGRKVIRRKQKLSNGWSVLTKPMLVRGWNIAWFEMILEVANHDMLKAFPKDTSKGD